MLAACARLPTYAQSQYFFLIHLEAICVRAQPRSAVPSQSAFRTKGFQSSTPTSRHMGFFKIEISQRISKASLKSVQGNENLKDSLKRHPDSIGLRSPDRKRL